MHRFRLRELVSLPGLLSLIRVPLAVAFPLVMSEPFAALGVVAAAGLSDVLDGWCARRSGQATPTGAVLDPVMDKLFVATVVLSLWLGGRMSFWAALLLGTRDLAQLPLVAWLAVDRHALAARSDRLKANTFGKLVTALQFATVAAALLADRYVPALSLIAGVSGLVAGASYWVGFLRRASVP
jgi:CDP-diacylglycerol--glycerol-3-phosphate 3-phosphatidyltransferase/cardiolipin synthase